MGKQAPAPPDYTGAANATAQGNKENLQAQTQANRPNVNTPFGFQSWSQDPQGNWTMSAGLSPEVQAAYANLKPFDLGAFGQAPSPIQAPTFGDVGTGEQARQQAIDSAYGQSVARLNPQFQQAEQGLDAKLANQGLSSTSAAARNARAQLGAQRNDAYGGAMANAISQGTAAGNSIFQNNLAGEQARFGAGLAGQQAQFGSGMQARQQAIAEALRARGMPMQDLQQLMGFMQTPDFAKAGAAQGPDLLAAAGLQGNYDLAAFVAQNQAYADMFKGGAELLKGMGAGAGAIPGLVALSDERAKTNITRWPMDVLPGVPVATFEYRDQPGVVHRGVIAQDVEKVRPELIRYRKDGMRMVDYAGLMEAANG